MGLTKSLASSIFSPEGNSLAVFIDVTDNVMKVSVETNSGTVTLQGNVTFKGLASTAITLGTGSAATVIANSNNQPISGLTIDATGGSVDVMISLV